MNKKIDNTFVRKSTSRSRFAPIFVLLLLLLAPGVGELKSRGLGVGTAGRSGGAADKTGLLLSEAKKRAKQVSRVDYRLTFKLGAQEKDFSGVSQIDFDLRHTRQDLRVDFGGGRVKNLLVNNQIADIAYNGKYLTLPRKVLRSGKNIVRIEFSHVYSTSGAGLHRFKDLKDGRTYMFTDLEPYDANLVFPCFDQPDLKATYEITAEAPGDWKVITSVAADRIEQSKSEKANRIHYFPRSKRFSTYIISLHAGPYKVWRSTWKRDDLNKKASAGPRANLPLALYARQSLAKYVDYENWFKLTRQGLGFFTKYFDYEYPFDKYDQLLVPEFNWGAMENVGAVTFNEKYIYISPPTRSKLRARANVLLHEMAHMWFGDLVTMGWWDDLWLNESFATFMAHLAMVEATEFKEAWHDFYTGPKQWAYGTDELVTTHPIRTEVENTGIALSNFDGITYGKGASALKQLAFYVGLDKFRDGVRLYMKRHAWGNTKLADFIDALSVKSGKNLRRWSGQWLESSGTNEIEVRHSCSGRQGVTTIRSLRILQKGAPLRAHNIKIALYDLRGGKLVFRKEFSVHYRRAYNNVTQLVGLRCPALIFANYGDYDFVRVQPQLSNLEVYRALGRTPGEKLLKSMLHFSLWQSVRRGRLKMDRYQEILLEHLGQESDPDIVTDLLELLNGYNDDSPSPAFYYTVSADGARALKRMEDLLWTRLMATKAGGDLEQHFLSAFIRIASSKSAMERLAALLEGRAPGGRKIKLSMEKKWDIVTVLNSFTYQGAASYRGLIETLAKRDTSNVGRNRAAGARAIIPDKKVKAAWWSEIVAPKSKYSTRELRSVMGALLPRNQLSLRAWFAPRFYKALPELARTRDPYFLDRLTESLTPTYCTRESVARLKRFIAAHPDLPIGALKNLRVAAQMDDECVKLLKR